MTLAAVTGAIAVAAALPAAPAAAAPQPIPKWTMGDKNGVIAATTSQASGAAFTVWPDGSGRTIMADEHGELRGAVSAWSADGHRVIVNATGGKKLLDVDPWTKRRIDAVPLTSLDPNRNIQGPSISPDGLTYAWGTNGDGYQVGNAVEGMVAKSAHNSAGTAWSGSDHLAWINDEVDRDLENDDPGIYVVEGATETPVRSQWLAVTEDEYPEAVSLSADGSKLAYAYYDNELNSMEIRVGGAGNGSATTALEAGGSPQSWERFAIVSPDGTKVAFVSDRSGSEAIYTANWDGTGVDMVDGTELSGGHGYSGLAWQPSQEPSLAFTDITTATEPGSTLKLDVMGGQEQGTAPLKTSWNWQECASTSAQSCSDTGVTTEGFPLTAQHVGKRYRVVRTVTNPAGTDTLESEITEAVTAPDTTPPGVPAIGTKPAAHSNDTSPVFTWTGAEDGGTFQCSVDEAPFTTCASGDPVPVTGEGPHRFRVRQLDSAYPANEGTPAEHTWTVDTTPPSNPNVTGRPGPLTASPTATIAFDGLDAGAKFECRQGKDPWAQCASPVTLEGLTDGGQSFSIRQVDPAGNTSAEPAVVEWEVDLTDPLAPSIGQIGGAVYTLSHQRSFTGEDGATFECQLDDGEWKACTSPVTLEGYTTGEHAFRVRQTDAAGHTGPAAEEKFMAYVNGPAAPSFGHTRPPAFTNQTTASFPIIDNGDAVTASLECRLDGGAWEACSGTKTLENLAEGKHTFEARAISVWDIPGEITKYEWTVDTQKPVKPVLTNLPPAKTTSRALNVDIAVEADTTLKCRIDGNTNANGAWAGCGADLLKYDDFPLGKHTFEIIQVDKAGNESEPASFAWEIVEQLDEPQPEVPEEPVKTETPAPAAPVETPAPAAPAPAPAATPAAPRATTPAPKAEAAAPAKPKLTAIVGEPGTRGGSGSGSGTSSAASIVVKKDGVGVGCSITGTVLTSCKVDLYVDRADGARAVAASRVLVGTGTVREDEGTRKMQVDVQLNATGRELMRRSPNGLKVKVAITGVPVKGEALKATGVATLVRQRVNAVVGGFAVDSAKLTRGAKRQLVKLARNVRGTAVAIRVVGHTDGSSQDNDYLKKLGERRAKAVATFLKAHGVKAKATLASRGDTKPRATNATKDGRAKNRRVELRIDR